MVSFGHTMQHWYMSSLWLVLPFISKDFNLSFSKAGIIVTVLFLISAATNLPGSAAVDMLGRRKTSLVIALIWAATGYFLMGLAPTYMVLILCAAFVGLGGSLWHPPAMSFLSSIFPSRRGLALSAHEFGGNLGDFISPIAIGYLLTWISWRKVVALNLAPGLLLAFLVWLAINEVKTSAAKKLDIANYRKAIAATLRNRTIILLCAISSLRAMGQQIIRVFLPLYLAYEVQASPATIGFYVSLLILASLFSGPLMGTISDMVGRLPILLAGLLITGLSTSLLPLARQGLHFQALLVLMGLFLFSMRPVIFAFALDVTAQQVGASTIGIIFASNQLMAAIAPTIAGALADRFGVINIFYLAGGLILAGAFMTILLPTEAALAGHAREQSSAS